MMLGLKKQAKQITKLSINSDFLITEKGDEDIINCHSNIFLLQDYVRTPNMLFIFCSYQSYNDFAKDVNDYIYYYNNFRIKDKTNWMLLVQYRLKFGS